MDKHHHYSITVKWDDPSGKGTTDYRSYRRDHLIYTAEKTPISASSDPAFRGDASRYNPEELFLASLSSCHMLWYLHLCADAGIVVTEYTDIPRGTMVESAKNGGQFTEVILQPLVVVQKSAMIEQAQALHAEAHRHCFIANSVNFPVRHLARVVSNENQSHF